MVFDMTLETKAVFSSGVTISMCEILRPRGNGADDGSLWAIDDSDGFGEFR